MKPWTDHEDWLHVPEFDEDASVSILEDGGVELAIGDAIYRLEPADAAVIGASLVQAAVMITRGEPR